MKREQVGGGSLVGKIFAAAFVVATLWGLMTSAALAPVSTGATWPAPVDTGACVLLVDDDQDGPDVRLYYTSALDELDVTYDVWDVASQACTERSECGDPSAGDLMGYQMVLWFTGYPRDDTFTSANEAAVAAYLDAEGLFFLSSEDYLYDRGLTTFGQTRLTIASYTNDVNRTDPVGVLYSPGSGLGPYNLTPPNGWPGDLYTDNVVKRSG